LILTKPREKEKKQREGKIKERKKRKKSEEMGEMVGDQTANWTAKPLQKRKNNHQFWNSRIAVLVFLMLLL
jgi:hypothetical protein